MIQVALENEKKKIKNDKREADLWRLQRHE